MCSIDGGLPSIFLPSPPPQQNHRSYGQRAARLPTDPRLSADHHSKSRLLQHYPASSLNGNGYGLSLFGGLKTPPNDDMSAACHQPPLGHYDAHPPTGLPQADRARDVLPQSTILRSHQQAQYARHQPQPQQPPPSLSHADTQRLPPILQSQAEGPRSQMAAIPVQSQPQHIVSQTGAVQLAGKGILPSHGAVVPLQQPPSQQQQQQPQQRPRPNPSSSLTGQSSEIPDFIDVNGGSLADLVAQITCLFWFEPIEVLQTAQTYRATRKPVTRRLSPETTPKPTFTKWVHNILNTTQVTRNVVLLALLFIYRLKKLNTTVKGRSGSEYRLLTVALMLGNKFLDDNTYTNKTWADVSYLSVSDIHLMEVEFLSNMKYNLYTSKQEWETWLGMLGSFHDYYEAARKIPEPLPPRINIPSPSPTTGLYSSPLPSPTSQPINGMMVSASPVAYSPCEAVVTNNPGWLSAAGAAVLANRPNLGPVEGARKRSIDVDLAEPPAKRMSHGPYSLGSIVPRIQAPPVTSAGTSQMNGAVAGEQAVRRMAAVPTLTINTSHQPMSTPSGYSTPTHAAPPVSLPPLGQGVRAMSTVYPQGGVMPMPQQVPTSNTMNGSNPALMTSMHMQPQQSLQPPSQQQQQQQPQQQPHPAMSYNTTPTKAHHHPQHPHQMYNSSPLAEAYHQAHAHGGLHTPISHSPSVYLQQRPSPYKPVRHVNTLLYPPPSASLEGYHAVPPQQMHYQPLGGRRGEFRTGVVPDFVGFATRGGYAHVQTPVSQHGQS